MGISGFLPLVKSVHETTHIKEFAGKTLAVDGNVWLHKGAFSCAMDLALNRKTTKYVDYFLRQVKLLQFYGVIPYIVFDGQPLPIKAGTVEDRRRRRMESMNKGVALFNEGNRREADEYFRKSVDVTPHMVQQVITALEERNIKYVIAPYEADAQLTYLSNTGRADAIITEDSDLLVFGCHTVIFKMDRYGEGTLIRHKNLANAKEIDLSGWDTTKIRQMCILSGCDYLPSLPGIGLKSAHKLLKQFRSMDVLLRHCRLQGKMKNVPDYEERFKRANEAFLYQYVYDPDTRQQVPLHVPPAGVRHEKMKFLGQKSRDHVAEFFKESNKENIPPWALVADNKPDNKRSISGRELFKVFNTQQRQPLASRIQTHLDSSQAFCRKDKKTILEQQQQSPQTTTTTVTTTSAITTTTTTTTKTTSTSSSAKTPLPAVTALLKRKALGDIGNCHTIPNKKITKEPLSPSSPSPSSPSSPIQQEQQKTKIPSGMIKSLDNQSSATSFVQSI